MVKKKYIFNYWNGKIQVKKKKLEKRKKREKGSGKENKGKNSWILKKKLWEKLEKRKQKIAEMLKNTTRSEIEREKNW